MSWRGLGTFPSPRSLTGMQGRGHCPLPYSPLGPQYCREKGQFTPNILLRRCCNLCCAHMQSRHVHILILRQTNTNRQRQTDKDKQTDNQPDRQTDNKQETNTTRSALPVMDRGYVTLVVVNVLLISIFPVEPNFYWRCPGQSTSRELSP